LPVSLYSVSNKASTSAGFSFATISATSLTNPLNSSFFETKSVSAFTSTIAPSFLSSET